MQNTKEDYGHLMSIIDARNSIKKKRAPKDIFCKHCNQTYRKRTFLVHTRSQKHKDNIQGTQIKTFHGGKISVQKFRF